MSQIAVWSEEIEQPPDFTKRDRFSAVLTIVVTAAALMLGLLIRQQSISERWPYVNQQVGIEALYPAGWLVDEQGDYVARIRDPLARPYKTQYIITVVPVTAQTSTRNILDNLTLQRSTNRPAYRVLDVIPAGEGNESYTRMDFVFVETDPNPFIEHLPVVVRGMDIVILDGNRAIIVTFLAAQTHFEANLPEFERFVEALRY